MTHFAQNKLMERASRGRPARSAIERIRTIAWYHFLAGARTPAQMAESAPFEDVDPATIYRYRRGEISPSQRMLSGDDEITRTASAVYEIGPFRVALWDAMEGAVTPEDVLLATRLMPGGSWPSSQLEEMLFDDIVLVRVVAFRDRSTPAASFTADLQTFATALRVQKALCLLGQGSAIQRRLLLEASYALPGARGLMTGLGMYEAVRSWIADQFKSDGITNQPAYAAEWMHNDDVFQGLCQNADERRAALRRHLFAHHGEPTVDGAKVDSNDRTLH
jgi:hypothetical protein